MRGDAAALQTPSTGEAAANVLRLRREMAAIARTLPAPDTDTRDLRAGSVPLRLYTPRGRQAAGTGGWPLLVFLHGGGWMLGDLETHDATCRQLCVAAGCAILAVGYRLAPEHPYPAALDDVRAALSWARANVGGLGCDAGRIAIGGESAGANLAAALTLVLRDAGEAQPLFQLLVHPPTDLSLDRLSNDGATDAGLSRDLLAQCIVVYAGETDIRTERLSPLCAADLSGLAPAVIVTVEIDPLRDEGELYSLALARAGVEVSVQRLSGLPHGFMFLPASDPAVAASFRLLGRRIARYFAP